MTTADGAAGSLVLRFPDPERRLTGVRLVTELFKREPPRMLGQRSDGTWELALRDLPVDRLEYQLELVGADGTAKLALDPAAGVVEGPFGAKSSLELDGYDPPDWLEEDAPAGLLEPLDLPSRTLRAQVTGLLWSAPGLDPDEPAPLLVVHDGPEYAEYSLLVRFLDVAAARGEIRPHRAALLAPVERDEHYSASARYTRALTGDLLPALAELAPAPAELRFRVGMGASLGALAMLHAQRLEPRAFGGLVLQSGSFFRPRTDRHERSFGRFARITRFVGTVLRAQSFARPVPVAMSCGTGEENLVNNRAMHAALVRQGYPATLLELRDGHTWTGWRDALAPTLPRLLADVWA
ncbi:MAG TPA: alpha/beta hydrolase-fold protein [Gaiellaceae bacterium]|nr:alpha/beta hydrolase-fold protein [Gaiellaceae bacterium]